MKLKKKDYTKNFITMCDKCEEQNKIPKNFKLGGFSSVLGKGNYYTCCVCGNKSDNMWILESL